MRNFRCPNASSTLSPNTQEKQHVAGQVEDVASERTCKRAASAAPARRPTVRGRRVIPRAGLLRHEFSRDDRETCNDGSCSPSISKANTMMFATIRPIVTVLKADRFQRVFIMQRYNIWSPFASFAR